VAQDECQSRKKRGLPPREGWENRAILYNPTKKKKKDVPPFSVSKHPQRRKEEERPATRGAKGKGTDGRRTGGSRPSRTKQAKVWGKKKKVDFGP